MKLKINGLVAIVCLLLFASCNQENDGNEIKVDLLPVKLSDNGKWSMVDNKGNVRYEDEFQSTPSAAIEGVFTAKEKKGYTLYITGDKKPEEMPECSELKSAGYMQSGLMPITRKNARITVIDKSGKDKFELKPINGHEIVECNIAFFDGMLAFRTDEDKWGFYSDKGEVAIKPKYDMVEPFSEGKAVVIKKVDNNGETKMRLSVIDKSGKELFSIKDKYELESQVFEHGWLVAKNDDKIVLIDEKGEITRLSGRVKEATPVSKDMIIFGNDDDQCGLMKIDGEILIRAKYKYITKGDGDVYYCIKDNKETVVLNSKNEETATLDFEALYFKSFDCCLGKDGDNYEILDSKYKPLGDDFEDISIRESLCYTISSDYFDYGSVVSTVTGQFDEALKEYPLNAAVSQVMAGENAADFSYSNEYSPKDMEKELFNLSTKVYVTFSKAMIKYSIDSYSYDGRWIWNPDATVLTVGVTYTCEHSIKLSNHKEMVNVYTKKGFSIVKEGMMENSYAALLKKDTQNIMVITTSHGGAVMGVTIADNILSLITSPYKELKEDDDTDSFDNYSLPATEEVAPVEEIAPIEETAVAEEATVAY